MPREQELALCAREIAGAERQMMTEGEDCEGAYVGLTDWLWELDWLLGDGAGI